MCPFARISGQKQKNVVVIVPKKSFCVSANVENEELAREGPDAF